MLRYRLTHPQILQALASAGHGSHVLISDGHYPYCTAAGPHAVLVYLNLTQGTPLVTDVLSVVLDAVAVESASVMVPPSGDPHPPVLAEIASAIQPNTPVAGLQRDAFYAAARSPDTALVIATGDTRTYANVMLTVGVAAD